MTTISELKSNPKNPRTISPEALASLKISLKKFGDLSGVVYNRRTDQLVGGHQRVKIFQDTNPLIITTDTGISYFEYEGNKFTYREVDWSEAMEAQANITANNPELQGQFDLDLLPEIIELAKQEDHEGLSLDSLSASLIQPDVKKEVSEDIPPELPLTPETEQGDLYEFGNHRLLCGDSTSPESVAKLMDGKLADLIHTDPPYMVDYHSSSGNSFSEGKYDSNTIFNDDLDNESALEFYTKVAKNLFDYSKENACFYWWYATSKYPINNHALVSNGWLNSQTIIWLKNSFVFSFGQMYHRTYEPCFVGWKKGNRPYCNPKITNLSDVFNLDYEDYQKQFDVWMEKRDNTNTYLHPTQKPVNLPARAIQRNSKPKEIVLDLFGGSGSTMMACDQLDRKSYNMELDPKFCDVIIKRWIKYRQENNLPAEVKRNGEVFEFSQD